MLEQIYLHTQLNKWQSILQSNLTIFDASKVSEIEEEFEQKTKDNSSHTVVCNCNLSHDFLFYTVHSVKKSTQTESLRYN